MNITELRKKAGLTQAELAARVGITQSEVSRIERGIATPERRTARAIDKALGVSGKSKPADRRPVTVGEEIFAAFDMAGRPIPGRTISRRTFDRALGDEVRQGEWSFGLGIPEETIAAEREYWADIRGEGAAPEEPICIAGVEEGPKPASRRACASESSNRATKDTAERASAHDSPPVALEKAA
jgi:transcriptional regulator with XRE-family HTH domain